MIHVPSGVEKPEAPSTENNQCTRRFPKQIVNSTFINERRYVHYEVMYSRIQYYTKNRSQTE